jgi:hypothetical protein
MVLSSHRTAQIHDAVVVTEIRFESLVSVQICIDNDIRELLKSDGPFFIVHETSLE